MKHLDLGNEKLQSCVAQITSSFLLFYYSPCWQVPSCTPAVVRTSHALYKKYAYFLFDLNSSFQKMIIHK